MSLTTAAETGKIKNVKTKILKLKPIFYKQLKGPSTCQNCIIILTHRNVIEIDKVKPILRNRWKQLRHRKELSSVVE